MTCNNLDELNELAKEDQILKEVVSMVEEHSQNDEIRGGYNKKEEIEREKLTERAEGKDERNIEIAKNMLNLKIDINTISASTGLSLNELKRISL